MGKSTFFELDLGPLEAGIKELLELPESPEVLRAAAPIAQAFLTDTLELIPTVPMDTGQLRGSGSVFINDDLWMTTAQIGYAHAEGTPAKALRRGDVKEGVPTITVVFNTPYAAKVHEMPAGTRWTTAGSGAKYIQRVLEERAKDYMQMWFEIIKDAMQKKQHKRN